MSRKPRSLALAVVALAATLSTSCFDPVHADEVAALGDEVAGVRTGPTHRPGQPCLVCHGGKGPGSPEFEIAGTIYEYRDVPSGGVDGITVRLTDVTGHLVTCVSNRAGNFYVPKDSEGTLYYPLTVELGGPDGGGDPRIKPSGVKSMITTIGRNAGCAFCHVNNLNSLKPEVKTTHMPHVFLNEAP